MNDAFAVGTGEMGSDPCSVLDKTLTELELLELAGYPSELLSGLLANPSEGLSHWAVSHLVETLDVDSAFVGELSGADYDRISTLEIYDQGTRIPNFSYDLVGTPCEQVLMSGHHYSAENAIEKFPDDEMLVEAKIEAYMGVALRDETGEPIGLVGVWRSASMNEKESTKAAAMLRLLQPRIEAELRYRRVMKAMEILASTSFSTAGTMLQLITSLAQVTRVKCAYIALHNAGDPDRARTLVTVVNSKVYESYSFSLSHSPCRGLSAFNEICIQNDLQKQHASDILKKLNATSFFALAIADSNGEMLGHVGLIHDRPVYRDLFRLPLSKLIVARLGAELRQGEVENNRLVLQRRLAKRQHHEGLGILAGGIAHDFNNLLVAISGPAEIIRLKVGGNIDVNENIDTILAATAQASGLCEQLLGYAEHKPANKVHFDFNELIARSQRIATMYTGNQCRLDYQLSYCPMQVFGSEIELQQALMNLIKNASDAISDGGSIVIETEVCARTSKSFGNAIVGKSSPSGSYATIRIVDDGRGMNDDELGRVFDRFFTTKDSGHGIGLSVVMSSVEEHGGALEVTSEIGVGTTFAISIPLVGAGPVVKKASVLPPPKSGRMVLVIDDDTLVRRVLKSMLKHAKVCCLLASGPAEGIALFEKHHEEIDLVTVDYTMPGLTGDKVLVQLRKISKEVPLILVSGNVDASCIGTFPQPPDGFLAKPFSNEELLRVLNTFGVMPDDTSDTNS